MKETMTRFEGTESEQDARTLDEQLDIAIELDDYRDESKSAGRRRRDAGRHTPRNKEDRNMSSSRLIIYGKKLRENAKRDGLHLIGFGWVDDRCEFQQVGAISPDSIEKAKKLMLAIQKLVEK